MRWDPPRANRRPRGRRAVRSPGEVVEMGARAARVAGLGLVLAWTVSGCGSATPAGKGPPIRSPRRSPSRAPPDGGGGHRRRRGGGGRGTAGRRARRTGGSTARPPTTRSRRTVFDTGRDPDRGGPWRRSLTVDTDRGGARASTSSGCARTPAGRPRCPTSSARRTAAGTVALVAPVTTWQAYNDWGGYSLYEERPATGAAGR